MATHFQLFIAASQLGWASYVRNKRATASLIQHIKSIEPVSDAVAKRIYFYTIQSAVTNLWFSTLRGYAPTPLERRNALYMGAITPLVDDATDENGMLSDEILMHLRRKDDDVFKAASGLYQSIRATAQSSFDAIAEKTLHAQDDSVQQLGAAVLSQEEIRSITFAKGGYATLVYRIMLQNELAPHEEEAILLLGSLLQMTNDAFDVYKDYHAGAQTMFTTTNDIAPLRHLYLHRLAQMKTAFEQTGYAPRQVKQLLHQTMLVLTRGLVCLDHLLACQQQYGTFNPALHPRHQLIVDMELRENIWKTWQYSRKLS